LISSVILFRLLICWNVTEVEAVSIAVFIRLRLSKWT
jgi:hypothetical protein